MTLPWMNETPEFYDDDDDDDNGDSNVKDDHDGSTADVGDHFFWVMSNNCCVKAKHELFCKMGCCIYT